MTNTNQQAKQFYDGGYDYDDHDCYSVVVNHK